MGGQEEEEEKGCCGEAFSCIHNEQLLLVGTTSLLSPLSLRQTKRTRGRRKPYSCVGTVCVYVCVRARHRGRQLLRLWLGLSHFRTLTLPLALPLSLSHRPTASSTASLMRALLASGQTQLSLRSALSLSLHPFSRTSCLSFHIRRFIR